MTTMKMKDFLATDTDIDVYDDVCEYVGIAKCGAYKLTEDGEKRFRKLLDLDVEINDDETVAVILMNDVPELQDESILYKRLRSAKYLFDCLAGYCTESTFDKYFVEV